MTRRLAKLPLQDHQWQMLGDDVGHLVLLADLHRSIARPLGTVGMDDIGPAILLHILIIHGTDNVDPPADIPTDGQRNAALERLTDGDAIALMLITMEGIGEIASQGDGGTQLDVAEDAHLMAHGLQGPGLIEAELTAIGRKEGRYLEYMHFLVESGER